MMCSEVLPMLDLMVEEHSEADVDVLQHLEICLSCHSVWTKTLSIRKRVQEYRNQIRTPENLPEKIRRLIAPLPLAAEGALQPPESNGSFASDSSNVIRGEFRLRGPIGKEDESVLGAFLEDQQESPAMSVAQELLREDIIEVMASLSPRERDVLRLRFGLDDGITRTLEEVALLYGVSPLRIRQTEAKALRKLRHPDRSSRRSIDKTD